MDEGGSVQVAGVERVGSQAGPTQVLRSFPRWQVHVAGAPESRGRWGWGDRQSGEQVQGDRGREKGKREGDRDRLRGREGADMGTGEPSGGRRQHRPPDWGLLLVEV